MSTRQNGRPRRVTPRRSVRIPDDLWAAMRARADERGETVTDAILRWAKRYVR